MVILPDVSINNATLDPSGRLSIPHIVYQSEAFAEIAQHWISDRGIDIPRIEGDFIMFPSWMMHGADPNTEDEDRCVVAGNIILHKIDSPRLVSNSYFINENITLWETRTIDNIQKEESDK